MEEYLKVEIGPNSYLYIHNELVAIVGTTHEFDPDHCLYNKKTGEKLCSKSFFCQVYDVEGHLLPKPSYGDIDDWYILCHGELIPVVDHLKEGRRLFNYE